LEKYAVRCGGGHNHRTGLFDAILIKDNHLALSAQEKVSAADAVRKAREFLAKLELEHGDNQMLVEVEVDNLEQLKVVLLAGPDLILLDNMTPQQLRAAVAIRNESAPGIELEASGGISMETIREVALSGVERISAGGLTHSATWLDIGLDWLPGSGS